MKLSHSFDPELFSPPFARVGQPKLSLAFVAADD
jgi:hypothetical protein